MRVNRQFKIFLNFNICFFFIIFKNIFKFYQLCLINVCKFNKCCGYHEILHDTLILNVYDYNFFLNI